MMIRQGSTQDDLGIWEALKDISGDGSNVNVNAKFYLAFTKEREELFRLI